MKKWLVIFIVVVSVLGLTFFFGRPDGNVHVSFLNVGQGDAILIQQGSIQILIDGGPSPRAITNELGRRMPYWDRSIELVVLTHSHQDHLAGLVEVLKRYNVSAILEPGSENSAYSTGLAAEWQRLLYEKQPRLITARANQEISLGKVTLTVLNLPAPSASGSDSDPDGNALVLNVEAGDFSFLLTSDIDREAEFDLLYNRKIPDCDVLKVAHHGSATSTSCEFLNVARPELAVISVGENEYGHPDGEVLNRLSGVFVYRTDNAGTVEFIIDDGELWVDTDS